MNGEGRKRRISVASSHYHIDEPEAKHVDKSLQQLEMEVSKILKEESSCPMATRRAYETQKIRALQKGDRKRYFGNSGRYQFYEKFHRQMTREERRKSRKRAQKLPPLEKTIELSERLVEQMDTSGTSSPTTWLGLDGGRNSNIWNDFRVKNDIQGEEDQDEAFLENPELGDREADEEDEEEDSSEEGSDEEGGDEAGDGGGGDDGYESPAGGLGLLEEISASTLDDLGELRRSSSQSQVGEARKGSLSRIRSWSSHATLDLTSSGSQKKKKKKRHTFMPVKSPVARENEILSPRAAYLTFCETEVDEDGTITRYGVDPEPLVIRKADTSAMVFRHYGVGDEVASALASSLKRMSGVTRLDFKDNMLTDRVIPKICAFVEGNEEIK